MANMTKADRQRSVAASQRQERRLAAAMGGSVRPGSGSQVRKKGDVVAGPTGGRSRSRLAEAKRTDRKSITIQTASLEKIRREALTEGRMHLLVFELGGRSYVILEAADYHDLEERQRDSGDRR